MQNLIKIKSALLIFLVAITDREIANSDMKIFNIFMLLGVPEATITVYSMCRLTLTVIEFNNKKNSFTITV